MIVSGSVCLGRRYFADGLTEKNSTAPQQAHRRCAPIECMSMSVPMFAFVYVPTRTGRNRNPNALNAAVTLLLRFSGALSARSAMKVPSLPQRRTATNALAKNAKMPTPRAASPSRTMSNGKMMKGDMPTQGSHFDFSSFLKSSINMRLLYKIVAFVANPDKARRC